MRIGLVFLLMSACLFTLGRSQNEDKPKEPQEDKQVLKSIQEFRIKAPLDTQRKTLFIQHCPNPDLSR